MRRAPPLNTVLVALRDGSFDIEAYLPKSLLSKNIMSRNIFNVANEWPIEEFWWHGGRPVVLSYLGYRTINTSQY